MLKKFELLYGGYILIAKNKDYRSLFLINIFLTIFQSMLVPVLPLWILNEIDVSPTSVFYILGAIGIGSFVLNIYIGHLTDLIGKRKLIIELQLILSFIRSIIYNFFPFAPVIIAISWITQLSGGSIIFAILSEKIDLNRDEKNKGTIITTVRTGVSIGYIVGPFFGISIVSLVSYSNFFLIYALLNLILLAATHFLIDNNTNKKTINKNESPSSNHNYKGYSLLLTTLFPLFLFIGVQTNGPLLALYLEEITSAWLIPIVFGIGPFFEIFAFPLVGRLNDKIGTRKIIFLAILGEILYFSMMALTNNIFLIILIQIFGVFHVTVLFSSLMIYVQDRFKERIGFSSSLYFSTISVSRPLGNILLGSILISFGYNFGFLLLGCIAILGLLAFGVLELMKRPLKG